MLDTGMPATCDQRAIVFTANELMLTFSSAFSSVKFDSDTLRLGHFRLLVFNFVTKTVI